MCIYSISGRHSPFQVNNEESSHYIGPNLSRVILRLYNIMIPDVSKQMYSSYCQVIALDCCIPKLLFSVSITREGCYHAAV